jgi:hypothetical protein
VLHEGASPEPSDFSTWLTTLVDHAADAGINISKRQDFMDLAHEMFDNDPKMGMFGGGHKMRERCANMLWAQYKMNQAHQQVQDHVANVVAPGNENEESGFSQALTMAKGSENEERARTKAPVLARALKVNTKTKKNPYPAGSLRAALWDDLHSGSEDEEEDPELQDDVNDEIPSDMDEPDSSDMSPDQLAMRITGVAHTSEDDEGDIEARLDDLEQRVSDIEGTDKDVGNDELLDQEREDNPEMDHPKADDDTDDAGIDQMGDDEYADDDGEEDPIAAVRNKPEGEKPRAFQPGARFQEDEEFSPEVTKTIFQHAITQPKQHMAQALKDEEDAGATAWLKTQLPKNPHPKDSPAHRAWMKGLRNTAAQALGINLKPRDPVKTKKKR